MVAVAVRLYGRRDRVVSAHPQFSARNPYAYFLYQFELGTLVGIVVVFLVLPTVVLAALARLLARSERLSGVVLFLVLVLVALRQFDLLYLRPWAEQAALAGVRPVVVALCALVLVVIAWRFHQRAIQFLALLAIPVVLAVVLMTSMEAARIFRLRWQPADAVPGARLDPDENIYIVLIDGFPLEYVQTSDGFINPDVAPHFARFVRDEAIWAPSNGANGTSTLMSAPSIVSGRIDSTDAFAVMKAVPTLLTLADSEYRVTAFVPSLNVACLPGREECYPPPKASDLRTSLTMLGVNYLKFTEPRLTRLLRPEPNWLTLPFESSGSSEVLSLATDLVASRRGVGHCMLIHTFFPPAQGAGRFSRDAKVDQALAQVHAWDLEFGRFLSALKRAGAYEQSIVAVVSDHGKDFSQPPLYGPMTIPNRRVLHTPLAVKPTGPLHPRVIRKRTQNVDLLPTIAALAGWTLPSAVTTRLDGQSLVDASYDERPLLFAHRQGRLLRFDWETERYWEVETEQGSGATRRSSSEAR